MIHGIHGSGFSKRGMAELAVRAHQHSDRPEAVGRDSFYLHCMLLLFYEKADFKSTVN